jgi:hypothetical protein
MRGVGVQSVHQRRAFQDNADPRVAVPVEPPLVTLEQAEPTLQIQVVADLVKRPRAHEQPGQEALHHRDHLPVDRVVGTLETIDQAFESRFPLGVALLPDFEGLRDFLDVRDGAPDRLLFGPNGVETTVDATGQPAELLLCESPFCMSTSR